MNVFTRMLDFFKSEFELSKEDEIKLLTELVENSTNFTKEEAVEVLLKSQDLSELLIKHVSKDDLISAVISKELVSDVVEEAGLSTDTIASETNPEKLAYHLAYEDTELGTQLLNELLYYRSQGRI